MVSSPMSSHCSFAIKPLVNYSSHLIPTVSRHARQLDSPSGSVIPFAATGQKFTGKVTKPIDAHDKLAKPSSILANNESQKILQKSPGNKTCVDFHKSDTTFTTDIDGEKPNCSKFHKECHKLLSKTDNKTSTFWKTENDNRFDDHLGNGQDKKSLKLFQAPQTAKVISKINVSENIKEMLSPSTGKPSIQLSGPNSVEKFSEVINTRRNDCVETLKKILESADKSTCSSNEKFQRPEMKLKTKDDKVGIPTALKGTYRKHNKSLYDLNENRALSNKNTSTRPVIPSMPLSSKMLKVSSPTSSNESNSKLFTSNNKFRSPNPKIVRNDNILASPKQDINPFERLMTPTFSSNAKNRSRKGINSTNEMCFSEQKLSSKVKNTNYLSRGLSDHSKCIPPSMEKWTHTQQNYASSAGLHHKQRTDLATLSGVKNAQCVFLTNKFPPISGVAKHPSPANEKVLYSDNKLLVCPTDLLNSSLKEKHSAIKGESSAEKFRNMKSHSLHLPDIKNSKIINSTSVSESSATGSNLNEIEPTTHLKASHVGLSSDSCNLRSEASTKVSYATKIKSKNFKDQSTGPNPGLRWASIKARHAVQTDDKIYEPDQHRNKIRILPPNKLANTNTVHCPALLKRNLELEKKSKLLKSPEVQANKKTEQSSNKRSSGLVDECPIEQYKKSSSHNLFDPSLKKPSSASFPTAEKRSLDTETKYFSKFPYRNLFKMCNEKIGQAFLSVTNALSFDSTNSKQENLSKSRRSTLIPSHTTSFCKEKRPHHTPESCLMNGPFSTDFPNIHTDSEDDTDESVLLDWANSLKLRSMLNRQQQVDPDSVFGPIAPLNMEEIFHPIRKSQFQSRSSSAHWSKHDKLSQPEIENYAKKMGYK